MTSTEKHDQPSMTVRLDRRKNQIPVVDPDTGLLWIVGKYGVTVRYERDPYFEGYALSEFASRDEKDRLRAVYPGRWPSDANPRTMLEVREIIDALAVQKVTGKVAPVAHPFA